MVHGATAAARAAGQVSCPGPLEVKGQGQGSRSWQVQGVLTTSSLLAVPPLVPL